MHALLPSTMHICLLNRTFCRNRGGIETFTATLANALANDGHIVHIVAEQATDPVQDERLIPTVHLHTFRCKDQLFKGAWRLEWLLPIRQLAYARAVAAEIVKLREEYQFDLLEAPASNLEAFYCVLDPRNRVVLRFHGGDQIVAWHTGKRRSGLKQWICRWLQQREIKKASGLIAVSQSVANFAKEYWGIHERQICVVHNGIKIPESLSSRQLRQNRILFVGLLHESKGIGVLAEAIRILERRGVYADYVIIGSESHGGRTEATTERAFRSAGYRSSIHFTGILSAEEVRRYYQTSTILVMPSLYEPFGLVAVEAMAAGCAVIASDVGGLGEIIENGKNGLLIPPSDPKALADGIRRLLDDPVLCESLGKSGKLRVREHFSDETMARSTLFEYEKIKKTWCGSC